MNSKTTVKALAVSSLMAMGVTACTSNPYQADSMDKGYSNSQQMKKADAKCGEGKCGEAKCAGEMKKADGKCGEGKCGGDMKKSDAKCGEGKCGGEMKKSGTM